MNKLPDADNTMIIYIVGDNGASSEGGPDGTLNEVKALNGFPRIKCPDCGHEYLLAFVLQQSGNPAYNGTGPVLFDRAPAQRTGGHSRSAGKKQSILVLEAVDRFIDQAGRQRRDLVLRNAAGIWKGRKDLPDFEVLRSAWDRCEA